MLRGGLADVAQIRATPPLPETADELCAVAADLHVPASDIYLGARATVAQVRSLSDSRELQRFLRALRNPRRLGRPGRR
jgi:hypothetical protein